jgi:transposase
VSLNSVKRYVKQLKDSGQLEPKPIPGRPAAIRGEKQALLLQEVKAKPDATLQERAEQWEQTQGLKLSRSTFSRSLKRLKLTYKKKPESQ